MLPVVSRILVNCEVIHGKCLSDWDHVSSIATVHCIIADRWADDDRRRAWVSLHAHVGVILGVAIHRQHSVGEHWLPVVRIDSDRSSVAVIWTRKLQLKGPLNNGNACLPFLSM